MCSHSQLWSIGVVANIHPCHGCAASSILAWTAKRKFFEILIVIASTEVVDKLRRLRIDMAHCRCTIKLKKAVKIGNRRVHQHYQHYLVRLVQGRFESDGRSWMSGSSLYQGSIP